MSVFWEGAFIDVCAIANCFEFHLSKMASPWRAELGAVLALAQSGTLLLREHMVTFCAQGGRCSAVVAPQSGVGVTPCPPPSPSTLHCPARVPGKAPGLCPCVLGQVGAQSPGTRTESSCYLSFPPWHATEHHCGQGNQGPDLVLRGVRKATNFQPASEVQE